MIVCRTLGPVEVSLDGGLAPPELQWRKPLALVVYLARSPRRTRTREHLVGLLWADKPEGAARHSLSEAIRLVRRCVGDDAIDTAAGQVHLPPGAAQLDVDQVEALAAAGDWKGAAALVAGEFMEGFSVPNASQFEDWLAAERGTWRARSVEVLLRHAEELMREGRPEHAVPAARRALGLDPRSERALRSLMRALALTGDAAAATAAYQEFGRALGEELGAEPDAETRALAERIGRERLPRPAPAPGRARREDEPARLPLVGREDELRRLLDLAAGCRGGRGAALLVIEGDSGTGKTRLVEELLARLRLEGVSVGTARAVEADRDESWSGVLTLARGGLLSASGIAAAPESAIARLAAELPEWAERFPSARVGPEPHITPGRALDDVLRAAAEEQPVFLAVDDAQWLDRESLLALGAALRDLATSPLGLVLTSSPHVVQPDLDELRARLGRDLPGAVVQLGPLGPQALRELAHRILPGYSEVEVDRLARRVGSDSAGIPLLAVEVLRAVALGLDLRATAGAWPEPARTLDQSMPGDLPDAMVAAIRIGFRRLGPDAQKVLAAASALGDRVASDLLARSLGLTAAAIAPALDELEWHRWLVCEPRGYGFAARIVRQVVERDMLTTGQRARIRRAAVLE